MMDGAPRMAAQADETGVAHRLGEMPPGIPQLGRQHLELMMLNTSARVRRREAGACFYPVFTPRPSPCRRANMQPASPASRISWL
jgi:hypothetical protein